MSITVISPDIRPSRPPVLVSTWLIATLTLLLSTGCSVFGIESVEEASYKLVRKDKQFEIRDYAPLIVAETSVNADYKSAGNKAFRALFAYISGENEASEKIAMTSPVIADAKSDDSGKKIAMTAPVMASKNGEAWRFRFVLPETYSLDSAPSPLNPDITLAETEPQRVATIRYSGRATNKARLKNSEALAGWIRDQGLTPQSEPRWAGYNAPWALPPFRRNEVLVDVSDQ